MEVLKDSCCSSQRLGILRDYWAVSFDHSVKEIWQRQRWLIQPVFISNASMAMGAVMGGLYTTGCRARGRGFDA